MVIKRKSYYGAEVLGVKKSYYEGLPEKQARHFLGQEYLELGIGSQRYLAEVFDCSRQTIKKGFDEVSASDFEPDYSRQRAEGGGRKKKKRAFLN
ncbi:MAG: hypothetical protein GY705_10800 [Bacteroidetes bacterium]|nr:hypothetical protein [Bacteroidota bacterium]